MRTSLPGCELEDTGGRDIWVGDGRPAGSQAAELGKGPGWMEGWQCGHWVLGRE